MRKVAVALVSILLLSTCGTKEATPEQKLKGFIDATALESRAFVYRTTDSDGIRTEITGSIQDDLRNQLMWKQEEIEILERIVHDDAMAVRIITPSELESLAAGPVGGSVIVGDALRSGRWVLDPGAAPPIVSRSQGGRQALVGSDPMQDAITVFRYMKRAIDESLAVVEFNEDAIEYRPDLDPFEKPNERLGVKRYDLVRQPLPRRSARSQLLPGPGAFRKMSWYVKDGKILKVVEIIDIESHEDFVEAKKTGDKRKAYLLEMMKAVQQGGGQVPVFEREMSIDFRDIGKKVTVALPSDVLTASLDGLFEVPASAGPGPAQPGPEATAPPEGSSPPPEEAASS